MIEVSDLQVTFNQGTPMETRALRGLSTRIEAGEFVTVIGSNGAGKSTLLNAISGDIHIDSGSIRIDDVEVTDWPTHRRAGRVARVFQDPMSGTCEGLTIEENLALASGRGLKRRLGLAVRGELRERFREQLSYLGLGLERRLGDKMGLLSGGQRQAVSLVMATLNPMKILLLDEHTAALDPKTAAFVMQLTDRLVEAGNLTTLMITHSMRQALEHGSRTLMLHEGRVVLDVAGEKRQGLSTTDLLQMFERVRGEQLDDDKLLMD